MFAVPKGSQDLLPQVPLVPAQHWMLKVPRWQAEVGRMEAAAPAGVNTACPGQSQE